MKKKDFYFKFKDLAMANFKSYDATDWSLNNYNTCIAQYIKK